VIPSQEVVVILGRLPDFIIIGTQKGGTTSTYRLLAKHPLVRRTDVNEVHYFDRNFGKGLEWYTSRFRGPEGGLAGEKSPYYLYHPAAARRAARTVPEAKLIALLRNPVDRAYSHYRHSKRRGVEPLDDFEEAVAAEPERLRGEKERLLTDDSYVSYNHQHFSYLSRGVYVDQLEEWARFFDKDQMLVVASEDLYYRESEALQRILGFLGLQGWEPEVKRRRKPTGHKYPPMDLTLRQRLEEYFEPHNRRLYEYLEADLGW